jgi:hypothetical protein
MVRSGALRGDSKNYDVVYATKTAGRGSGLALVHPDKDIRDMQWRVEHGTNNLDKMKIMQIDPPCPHSYYLSASISPPEALRSYLAQLSEPPGRAMVGRG